MVAGLWICKRLDKVQGKEDEKKKEQSIGSSSGVHSDRQHKSIELVTAGYRTEFGPKYLSDCILLA